MLEKVGMISYGKSRKRTEIYYLNLPESMNCLRCIDSEIGQVDYHG